MRPEPSRSGARDVLGEIVDEHRIRSGRALGVEHVVEHRRVRLGDADLRGVVDLVELVGQVEHVQVASQACGAVGEHHGSGLGPHRTQQGEHLDVDVADVRLPLVQRPR